jgi:6,7-dimethyl-8-ribityllumazine synthase
MTTLKKQNTKQLFDTSEVKDFRIAIVRTDYHESYVSSLEKHAIETLIINGIEEKNVTSVVVPGAWEIPLAVKKIAETKKFDAVITFGVVLKGDTLHFEMIANEVGRALMQLSLEFGIPVALEVLAVFDLKQAEERTRDDEMNKGIEAATAVLKTLMELKKIKSL